MLGPKAKTKAVPEEGLDVGQTGLNSTGEGKLVEVEEVNAGICHFWLHSMCSFRLILQSSCEDNTGNTTTEQSREHCV